MKILDGKKLADKILSSLKITRLKLAVILVGNDPSSKLYVSKKRQACEKYGIGFQLFAFPSNIKQEELEKEIKDIAEKDNTGILIQLPLPEGLNTERVLELIPPHKDVEGFVSSNKSPIVYVVEEFLKEYDISLENKNILVVGKGRLVGKPISQWLEKKGLDFQIIDQSTEDINKYILEADVIISGAGEKNLIKDIKQGAVVIDFGPDVNFEKVKLKTSYITPPIGGTGPMTIACLLKNLSELKN